ncbi:MAG TPA: outer membrane beta-barrel protein, partial [Candidatus Goldiibacteriota bacterium]|nr:outer membrane beta-barrel protein [Candidatus Goldiibacteriota bacterium]
MKKTLMVILTVLALLPAAASAFELWIINPRGGIAFPLGQLGDNTSLSWNAGVSARKGFDREIAAGGSISFATMPYKVTSAPEPFACTILNAEFTFTPYLPDLFVWPYLKVGAGVFLVKYAAVTGTYPDYSTVMQDETAFGIILGGGVNYPVTNEIAANLEILYNQASVQGGQGDNYNFLTFNLG